MNNKIHHKVCQITTVHPINDNRVFHKECKTLAQNGYYVNLVIQHDKDETIDGVHVLALPKPKNRFSRIFGLTFKAMRRALKQKADIYHFHDSELIPVGIMLKLLGKKVIYDVHENVPKQFMNKDWLGNIYFKKIAAAGMSILEKFCKIFFDVIIVARPDIAEHLSSKRTKVILNAAVLKTIDEAPDIKIEKTRPVVIYAGGITKIRGITEIIQAMEILDGKAELWLLGPWQIESFRDECKKLPGWKYVNDLGYKPVQEVFSYMKKADIGIVTFWPAPNHLTTLPNKPFEYMSSYLPVIMSNFDYWQEIFQGCAIFTDPQDTQQIAEKINLLLDDKNLAKNLAVAGRKLVEDKYSWEAESKNLLQIYQDLLTK
ncbi:MAG: glycosyltransferase family 4 protein [Sedimentisphaerales bacterium]|nr:glycosyltransferase family 4 protein [Sedimentisphaerales bacterium]